MEGLGTDLFATKGIEYLIVIAYLAVLVGFWRLLSSEPHKRPQPAALLNRLRGWFEVRDGYYYHRGHAWALPEQEGLVRVGIDDFAQRLLGRPDAFELPALGTPLKAGHVGWSMRIAGKAIDMLSPVDGEVVAVNEEALGSPGLVNGDPYGEGWLLKVKGAGNGSVRKNLLTSDLARAWLDEIAEKIKSLPVAQLGVVMPDGGIPVSGFARSLAPEDWERLAREFLLTD